MARTRRQQDVMDFEKLGLFYLGREVDADSGALSDRPLLYDAADLVTHAVIVGMTGSGKTGLGIGLIEEAAIDGIPVLAIDPKGDLANLLLTFPNLDPDDFAPWIDPDEARVCGVPAGKIAAREAARWREGLAEWGQNGARIRALRDAAEFGLYTPGSRGGRPLSILASFQPPPRAAADPDLLPDLASAAGTSLLTLAGLDAEPMRSREHILVTTLLTEAWRQGRSMDLAALIGEIQSPPVARLGVMDLESFYPSADRFRLATDLNRLLAAPDFSAWLAGEPLDVDTLLYTAQGRPRVSVVSIAHLGDRERMFFVSLLLADVVAWMRAQRGTSTLRALLYFDEVMGFLPPVANPPSKLPLLTLLKQARAAGLGLVLATQNPVDLDYKALSNAGTWFLGRLQTERDKARVLDGVEAVSAQAGHGLDRQAIDRRLSALPKRTFVLHNVHHEAPLLFQTRWTLSYLRGPLGRAELAALAAGGAPSTAPSVGVTGVGGQGLASPRARDTTTAADAAPAEPIAAGTSGQPVTAVRQYFAPGRPTRWRPMLLGAARITYSDARQGVHDTREVVVVVPFADGPVPIDWALSEPAPFAVADLHTRPTADAPFAPLPRAAADARRYAVWERDFARWAAQAQTIELVRSPAANLTSQVGEAERAFRIRVDTRLREQRDTALAKLRQKYAARLSTLDDRLRRARQAIAREQQQATDSKVQAGVSIAATIFSAVLGPRAVSAGSVGRATTAARGMSRAGRQAEDVARARAELAALEEKRRQLEAVLDRKLQQVADEWDTHTGVFERVLVKPARGGVSVQLVSLVWIPA